MITAVPLNQETSKISKSVLPIMLGVIGSSLVIGGLLASRRKHESSSSHSNGGLGIPAVVIGGLLVAGVAGTIYFVSRNGQSKTIQNTPVKQYINTKEWDITYNDDGLPVKIVKHVRAEIT